LNRLYLQLIQSDASPSRRQQVKNQLDQAEAERKAILTPSISSIADTGSAADTGSVRGATPQERVSPGNEPALVALLENQIEGLHAQLDSRRALIDALDKERVALNSTHQQVVQGYSDTIKENMAQIQELSATVAQMREEIRAALAAADRKAREVGSAQPLDGVPPILWTP
jgi:thymidylate kinase